MVSITDLKFMDRIQEEAVTFHEVFLDETDLIEHFTFEIEVENLYDAPLEIPFEWYTKEMDWVVEPYKGVFILEPGGSDSITYTTSSAGERYPLPRFILRYPYREHRYFTYDDLPRFLCTQEVRPLTEPVVDGFLAPGEWTSAAVTEAFYCPEGGPTDIEQTRFYWGYDDEHLYIAADCVQKDPESLLMLTEETDGAVYYDDCVGFFFAPEGPDGDTFKIYFNPKAVSFDQRIFMTDEGYQRAALDPSNALKTLLIQSLTPRTRQIAFLYKELFSRGCVQLQAGRSATAYGEGGWSIEIAIPYSTLETDAPAPGDAWRVNFRRKEIFLNSSSDWQYPIDYDSNLFGRLLFTD